MNKGFCIATISWARNEEEEMLLKKSLQTLAALELPVFITDGGSGDSFLKFVRSFPHFTLLPATEKGVYAQARNSVLAAHASNHPYIIYTEPDKESFFRDGLSNLMEEVGNTGPALLLASRSKKGLESFPLFQQMTEATINNCCGEVVGKEFDYTYGPFIFKTGLAPYLNKIKSDIGWGWRPYLFLVAHRLGFDVQAIVADFMCPVEQRNDDAKERIYRMKQLEQNIRGIVLASEIDL